MNDDGTCPDCGRKVDVANVHGSVTPDNLDLKKLAGKDADTIPWHFKLLVGLLCMYLGWRVVQLFSAVL